MSRIARLGLVSVVAVVTLGACKSDPPASAAAETPGSILTKLRKVDGAGSGLDADLLSGRRGSEFIADTGAGLLKEGQAIRVDPSAFQRRIQNACPTGSSITAIAEDGVATCAADQRTPFGNTIVVSASEDASANGTALLRAVKDVQPSGAKRWALHLEPGVYDIDSTVLDLTGFAVVQGAGNGATVIRLFTSTVTNHVLLRGSTLLRDLSFEVESGGSLGVVYWDGMGTAVISDVSMRGGGANGNVMGFDLNVPRAEVTRLTVQLGGPGNTGVWFETAGGFITDSNIDAGGESTVGVDFDYGTGSAMRNTTVIGDTAIHFNQLVAPLEITTSHVIGANRAVSGIGQVVFNASLVGGPVSADVVKCLGSFNAQYEPLGSNCQ